LVTGIAQESRTLCEGTLREAIAATEDDFMTIVSRSFRIDSSMAQVGSCVLVGLIWRGILYIANLGDSRAVVGCAGRCNSIIAEQLTRDHNVGREDIRQELRALHPNDPDIVVMNRGAWRVKGIIQVFFCFYLQNGFLVICLFDSLWNFFPVLFMCNDSMDKLIVICDIALHLLLTASCNT